LPRSSASLKRKAPQKIDQKDAGAERWRRWLLDGLAKPGKLKSHLARRLGLDASQITRMLRGDRVLNVGEILVIADYLDCDVPPECVGLIGEVMRMVDVMGVVQEGVPYDGTRGEKTFAMPYVASSQFGKLAHRAVLVEGEAVNQFIPDGFVAVCVPYLEARQTFEDGDFVLIHIIRQGKVGISRAIRRVSIEKGVVKLSMASYDRKLNNAIRLTGDMRHDAATGDAIEIVGLLVWRGGSLA
jgi:Cro/C1-type HTH DNA-binding domain